MLEKSVYPKTVRLNDSESSGFVVTEKLDGSNLVIFKLEDEVYVATRNNIFSLHTDMELIGNTYKGLREWCEAHYLDFVLHLCEGSALCGEWLGMGHIKYPVGEFEQRFYMFAKANISPEFELYNIKYNHSLFIYPFTTQIIPYHIGIVPVVATLPYIPTVAHLNNIYQNYCNKVDRPVEGFVVEYNNTIRKYVRLKRGVLQEHRE